VIHTNLGRAVLPQAAIDHVVAMMAGPNNLEYDLEQRPARRPRQHRRGAAVRDHGREAATVVNNNAAAVLLTIAALAQGAKRSSRAANSWKSAALFACPT